ncbi:MAG: M14 family zinc carboxypeptidase, partial [Flavobacteriia bacterium]
MIKRFVRTILVLCSLFLAPLSNAQWTGNTSPTYPELIAYYRKLDKEHKEIELYAMGPSDYGLPIYVCVINGAQDSLLTFSKAKQNTTILINNAIHAGEPDGVNACLIWLDEWIKKGKQTEGLPVIAIIPAYNVGGMMNRNGNSRANQNGPEEYGFRGNAQNLDLNRDFIKMDSKNAFTFATIYQALDPDVFVDTHVSNGADYQYTLTYISSMKERMAPSTRSLMHDKLIPDLTRTLKKKKWDLFPYV